MNVRNECFSVFLYLIVCACVCVVCAGALIQSHLDNNTLRCIFVTFVSRFICVVIFLLFHSLVRPSFTFIIILFSICCGCELRVTSSIFLSDNIQYMQTQMCAHTILIIVIYAFWCSPCVSLAINWINLHQCEREYTKIKCFDRASFARMYVCVCALARLLVWFIIRCEWEKKKIHSILDALSDYNYSILMGFATRSHTLKIELADIVGR